MLQKQQICSKMSNFARNFRFPTVWHMKNEILATIAQGTLRGKEEEGMMTFYRIPYGTNTGRFREVGAAPTWEGTRDASDYKARCYGL